MISPKAACQAGDWMKSVSPAANSLSHVPVLLTCFRLSLMGELIEGVPYGASGLSQVP